MILCSMLSPAMIACAATAAACLNALKQLLLSADQSSLIDTGKT